VHNIASENMNSNIHDMVVKYDVQQKELDIISKQAEIDRQTMMLNIFFMGLAIALLIVGLMIYIILQRSRRNRELAEMNAIKDKFFSIVSHDLKNPVATQHNALQLLANNVNKWDANTLSNYSEQLLKVSDNLMELLKNLLNWSMMQSGRKKHNPILFNLVASLQPDLNAIKNMTETKNITFETQLPETTFITGDENMLITIVRNLLTNAVKFTATEGTVKLEIVANGDARGGRDGARPASTAATGYIISITDTGIGMSEKHLRDLFRLDRTYSKRGTANEQGTGLGLIVCRDMLQKHGSTLHVESEEGKGSKFWFEI